MTKLTPKEIDLVCRIREETTLPLNEIGEMFGVSRGCVEHHCVVNGAESPKPYRPKRIRQRVVRRGANVVRRFTPSEDAVLLRLKAQDIKDHIIAKRLARPQNSIAARLRTLARREEAGEMNR